MRDQRLKVRCIPFYREALHSEICRASFAGNEVEPSEQVRYLGSYLSDKETGANTCKPFHKGVEFTLIND